MPSTLGVATKQGIAGERLQEQLRILVDNKQNINQYCCGLAKQANLVLRYVTGNILCKVREAIILLCLTSTWPCWNSIESFGQDTLKQNKRMQNNFENPEEST